MTVRFYGLLLLLSLPGLADAGNDTYCVGAPGPLLSHGLCNSSSVRAKHGKWHFHVYVTDGTDCYQCFDERDNTCETDFLTRHPEWMPVSAQSCAVLGRPPADTGVKFHVIAGQDVASTVAPAPPAALTVTTEVSTPGRGRFAIGDDVTFTVRTVVGEGEGRPFQGGELVLVDGVTGAEVLRVPVEDRGDGQGTVTVKVPSLERVTATLQVERVALQPGETEGSRASIPSKFKVTQCPWRADVEGVAGALLLGGDELALSGRVYGLDGQAAPAALLSTRAPRFILTRADGSEQEVPATVTGGGLRGAIIAPEVEAGTEQARVELVVDGEPPVCAGASLDVTLSKLPLTLSVAAPETCWTGRPCQVPFTLGRPSNAAGASRAQALLSDPGLEIIPRVGGQRTEATRSGDTFTVEVLPTREGRVHVELELLWSGSRSLQADAAIDVTESIDLQLPNEIVLGDVSGGLDPGESCVPLRFAGAGVLGATFSVALAEPCGQCEARIVSVSGGQRYDLPIDELTIGVDQELPICLDIARCPTAETGVSIDLLVRPTEPLFADQVRRVSVSYTVRRRSALDCWSWVLWWLLPVLGLAVVIYGWVRPEGFAPGSSLRLASSEKNLRRAPRVLLEEQPGGKRGWYRSARVYIDVGGAATRRRRDALVTVRPQAGGVTVTSRAGIQRQDRRTRRMEPVDSRENKDGVMLQRARVYQAGSLLIKAGS